MGNSGRFVWWNGKQVPVKLNDPDDIVVKKVRALNYNERFQLWKDPDKLQKFLNKGDL